MIGRCHISFSLWIIYCVNFWITSETSVGGHIAGWCVWGGWCQMHLDSNPDFLKRISYLTSVSSSVKWGIITTPTWWLVVRIKWDKWCMVSFLLIIISFFKDCALTFCLHFGLESWGPSSLWVSTLHSGITWGAFSGLSLGYIQTVTSKSLGVGQQHQALVKPPHDPSEQPQLRSAVLPTLHWVFALRAEAWVRILTFYLAQWPWANT